MNLRKLAKGRPCEIRLPGICNGNPETVVACHYRMPVLSGLGTKPADCFISFGCSDCHRYVDTHHDDETQLAFAQGVFRTQAWLVREGYLRW